MVVNLRSEDPARNRHRHYLVSLQRDLWGELVVVKRWGRVGAPGWQNGQTITVAGEDEGAGVGGARDVAAAAGAGV